MNVNKQNWSAHTTERAWVFSKALPMQLTVHELRRALARLPVRRGLTIGIGNPLMVHHLCQADGAWEHLVLDDQDTEAVREATGASAHRLQGTELPFDDKVFDVVILVGCLETAPDDQALIHECHRVLSTDGRLILCTRNRKRMTLIHPMRRGLPAAADGGTGPMREGYTEKELFALLKNGFDVVGMRSFMRFCVEAVDAWVGTARRRGHRERRIYALAGPLYRMAFQLDTLLMMTRGHRWIVVGKRRTWRARQAPILGDGRTITEAVLSRPSV